MYVLNDLFSFLLLLFFSDTSKETGFHRSTRLCLEHIREALLHHRWQEAAEYMSSYPQILEATTFVSVRKDKEVGLFIFESFCALEVLK